MKKSRVKRNVAVSLILCLLLAMLIFPVGAAKNFVPNNNGQYSVSYDSAITGNEYVILIVGGLLDQNQPNISVVTTSNILYIDQVTAVDGKASFENFIPMTTKDSTILISGQGMEKPVVLGYIETNVVTLQGRGASAQGGVTVTLTNNSNTSRVYSTTTNAQGKYSFSSVPNGQYTLNVSMPGYLSYTDKTFDVNGPVANGVISLLGGDVNGDDQVTGSDISLLLSNYLKPVENATTPAADINGDLQITGSDLSSLLSNYLVAATVVE